jgi:hypothetical protein
MSLEPSTRILPDDAIHRGPDRYTDANLARMDNFLSNFEPLSSAQLSSAQLSSAQLRLISWSTGSLNLTTSPS